MQTASGLLNTPDCGPHGMSVPVVRTLLAPTISLQSSLTSAVLVTHFIPIIIHFTAFSYHLLYQNARIKCT
jgi:hypothetical protein